MFSSPLAFICDEMSIIYDENIVTISKLVVLLYEQNKDISDC